MMKRVFFAINLIGLCLLAAPYTASAARSAHDIYNGVDCGVAKTATVCTSKTDKDPLTGSSGAIIKIIDIVSFIAGAAAVIIIILGGIRYITSNGDSNNVNSAKNTVMNALIGLAIIVMSRAFLTYVVKRL